jgi:hypothetical protein
MIEESQRRLVGAKRIASYRGDEQLWPYICLGRKVCTYTDSLDETIAAKEGRGLTLRKPAP